MKGLLMVFGLIVSVLLYLAGDRLAGLLWPGDWVAALTVGLAFSLCGTVLVMAFVRRRMPGGR